MTTNTKKFRVTCSNPLCKNIAMLEGHSDNPNVKKKLVPQRDSKTTPAPVRQRLLFRCIKCGNRWHMQSTQVH